MIQWAIHRVWWFLVRVAVTLACIWTIQNLIHTEGYYIPFHILLVGAICLILGVRIWMPAQKDTGPKETTFTHLE